MSNLSIKFIQGLQKLGYSYHDIKNWSYCGGKSFSDGEHQLLTKHEKYFMQCYPNTPFPQQCLECVCGQELIHNCYIRKDNNSPIENILIVGQCCVEKFIDGGIQKVCAKCSSPHNNRSNNLCNDCRKIQNEKEKEKRKILSKTYYDIPYNISKEHKCVLYNNKCKWNSDIKVWYTNNDTDDLQYTFERYHINDILDFIEKRENKHIEYFNIDYKDREQAKIDGLKWDKDEKKWYKQY